VTYLLDVSVLIALLWGNHVHHARAKAWAQGKTMAVCPITELGYLRISSKNLGATMSEARASLGRWLAVNKPGFIPCGARALDGLPASSSGKTTDFYLANLAQKHGLLFATLDENVNHPSALLIPAIE
jgi:predicted nucleic acid-binding protein